MQSLTNKVEKLVAGIINGVGLYDRLRGIYEAGAMRSEAPEPLQVELNLDLSNPLFSYICESLNGKFTTDVQTGFRREDYNPETDEKALEDHVRSVEGVGERQKGYVDLLAQAAGLISEVVAEFNGQHRGTESEAEEREAGYKVVKETVDGIKEVIRKVGQPTAVVESSWDFDVDVNSLRQCVEAWKDSTKLYLDQLRTELGHDVSRSNTERRPELEASVNQLELGFAYFRYVLKEAESIDPGHLENGVAERLDLSSETIARDIMGHAEQLDLTRYVTLGDKVRRSLSEPSNIASFAYGRGKESNRRGNFGRAAAGLGVAGAFDVAGHPLDPDKRIGGDVNLAKSGTYRELGDIVDPGYERVEHVPLRLIPMTRLDAVRDKAQTVYDRTLGDLGRDAKKILRGLRKGLSSLFQGRAVAQAEKAQTFFEADTAYQAETLSARAGVHEDRRELAHAASCLSESYALRKDPDVQRRLAKAYSIVAGRP